MSKQFFDDYSEADEIQQVDEEGQDTSMDSSTYEDGSESDSDMYQDHESEIQGAEAYSDPDQEEPEMDESQILSDARLRLEQGRLYEMLIKHPFFGEVDADPRAVKNVEREIKGFLKERLEIMLGIKQEKQVQKSGGLRDDEILILKGLISKAKNQVLAPKAFSTPPVKTSQPTVRSPLLQRKPVQKQPQPALNRKPRTKTKESEPLNKSVFELSPEELAQRNREIAERQAARKAAAPGALPMPDPTQEQMIYQTNQMMRREQNNGSVIFDILSKTGNMD